jgi:hypothetical protein
MRKLLCSALLLCLLSSAAAAEKPTVDSILDRYVKESGGKEAIEKTRTIVSEGQIEFGDTVATFKAQSKAPDKTTWKIEGDQFLFAQGWDGKKGWKKDPSGIGVLNERELRTLKRNGSTQTEIMTRSLYPNLEYKGTEKLDGEEVHILESAGPNVRARLAFSTKTGLLVGSTIRDGDYKSEARFSNFKKTDGVLRAHTVREAIEGPEGGFEFTLSIKKMTVNEEVKDDLFQEPKS